MSPGVRRHFTIGKIAFALGALYLAIGLLWPGSCNFSVDSDAKELQMLSLRWDHGVHLDFVWPGRAIDPEYQMVSVGWTYFGVVDGKIQFAWPPAFAFLSRPFYALLGRPGVFVLPALAGAACVFLAGKIAERIRSGTGPIAVILIGLATPLFFYSTMFWEHTPALACGLVGLLLVVRGRNYRSLFFAGVALAAAAGGFRSDFYVFAAAVIGGAFFAWTGRERFVNAFVVGAGAIVGSVPWFLVNHAVGRHVVPLNAVNNSAPASLAYLLEAKLGTIPHYLVGMTVPEPWRWRLTGIAIVVVVVVRATWRRVPWVAAAALMVWAAAVMVLVREVFLTEVPTLHGWLLAAPIAVLMLAAPPAISDDDLARRIITYATALHLLADYVLIMACYPNGFTSDGNGEWGPRYYIGVFPLLGILAAQRVVSLARSRPLALGVAFVVFASIAVEVVGLGVNRHRTLVWSRVRVMLDTPDDLPLIADLWWIPALRQEEMFTRPSFTVRIEDADRFPMLVPRLWRAGYRRVRLVSMIPWPEHPFSRIELPDGLELVMVDHTEQDKVKATTLEIRARQTPP